MCVYVGVLCTHKGNCIIKEENLSLAHNSCIPAFHNVCSWNTRSVGCQGCGEKNVISGQTGLRSADLNKLRQVYY